MNSGLDILSVLTGVISAGTAVFGMWLKIKFDERKSKQFNYDPNLHSSVVAAIEYVRSETQADRVYVLEFHNGEHYFSGRSQQKLSCTYEVMSEGISAESHNMQNIRNSNFHGLVKSIVSETTFRCPNLENYSQDIGFKSFLERKGVQSMFARPIKTLNGRIVGLLCLEYVKEKRAWSEEAEDFVKKQATTISGYLI